MEYIDQIDSLRNKTWASGSKEFSNDNLVLISENSVINKTINYSPALIKIFDELIVNATDHIIRCLGSDNEVTKIDVKFDLKSGSFSIKNDGIGFNQNINEKASQAIGKPTYTPTMAMGIMFQGSNYISKGIIGGTNGIGAKLTNCHSDIFEISTSNGISEFSQIWTNNMKIQGEPSIVKTNKSSYTLISSSPTYSDFNINSDYFAQLDELLYSRLAYSSIYINHIKQYKISENLLKIKRAKDIELIYNNKLISYSLDTFVSNIPKTNEIIHTKFTTSDGVLSWNCVVIYEKKYTISVVNGIVVNSGTHIQWLFGQISKFIKNLGYKTNTSTLMQSISIVACCQIADPSWTGQTKESLKINTSKISQHLINKATLSEIAKNILSLVTKKTKKPKITYDKYYPAKYTSSSGLKCSLLAVEGDSAMNQLRTAQLNVSDLGTDYYGIISLGGVIINVRKHSEITDGNIIRNNKLQNNKFMKVLVSILGLNFDYKYDDKSETYKKEIKGLNYGCVIAVVDQDVDGKGNILSLLLNAFEVCWPNLLKSGYIKWYPTPIIRVFPPKSGKVLSFYFVSEYKKWEENNQTQHKVQYYKGLGTHSREETISMFTNFKSRLMTFTTNSLTSREFEIYFGDNPELRKKELSKPLSEYPDELIKNQALTHNILCNDHLQYETKYYQIENIERKLDHIIDGQNQSGRKIIDALMRRYHNSNEQFKIESVSGYISQTTAYHHGEESLRKTLTGKGHTFVGGKQLPFILPQSNFGSRMEGGSDAASPRYIWGKLNNEITNILFNKYDYDILKFRYDDGVKIEPQYFIPIIPLAVIESAELPAHGWKIKTWGRDVISVINAIRQMIYMDSACMSKLRPNTHNWNGSIEYIPDEYSFGKYSIEKYNNYDSIKIIELPLRTWTKDYYKYLKIHEEIIEEIIDNSDDISVNIRIVLKPHILEEICNKTYHIGDPIISYFKLYKRMKSHLNFVGAQFEVVQMDSYEEVLNYWFPIRKNHYKLRIERQIILLELNILYYSNIIRFINHKLLLNNKSEDEMVSILSSHKYNNFSTSHMTNNIEIPNEELRKYILETGASYNYLLNLSERDKSQESLNKHTIKHKALSLELSNLVNKSKLGKFIGSQVWLDELDLLQKKVTEGRETGWKYNDLNKYTYT